MPKPGHPLRGDTRASTSVVGVIVAGTMFVAVAGVMITSMGAFGTAETQATNAMPCLTKDVSPGKLYPASACVTLPNLVASEAVRDQECRVKGKDKDKDPGAGNPNGEGNLKCHRVTISVDNRYRAEPFVPDGSLWSGRIGSVWHAPYAVNGTIVPDGAQGQFHLQFQLGCSSEIGLLRYFATEGAVDVAVPPSQGCG